MEARSHKPTKFITYYHIEQLAINSDASLPDFMSSLWIFLCKNNENCKALGRELRIRQYSNPGNVYYEILARLIGHIDNYYKINESNESLPRMRRASNRPNR